MNLSKIEAKWIVVYTYPGDGLGVRFPSLRGCTPESCGFRDAYPEFEIMGAKVFGISTQSTSHQQEFARKNNLPFPILSDQALAFAKALSLPTLEVEGDTVLDRLTLIADKDHRIRHVFALITDPTTHAFETLDYLKETKQKL